MALRSQSGQGILEAVLLLVVMVMVAMALSKALKEAEFLQALTINPWAKVSGMVECGVWQACGINGGAKMHPSTRGITFRPEAGNP